MKVPMRSRHPSTTAISKCGEVFTRITPCFPAKMNRQPSSERQMKTNMLATSLLLSLGLSVASAGQPDTRFYGKWVGVESYEVPRAVTRYGYRRNEPPIKKSAVVVVGNSGQTLSFEQGLLQ